MQVPMCTNQAVWENGEKRWSAQKGRKWPEGVDRPRTCSHCGSVHPEDLIELVKQGWELEPTGKCYKYYFHPLGYAEEVYRMSHAITEGALDSFVSKIPSIVPCVKLYMQHMSPEAQEVLNDSIVNFCRRTN